MNSYMKKIIAVVMVTFAGQALALTFSDEVYLAALGLVGPAFVVYCGVKAKQHHELSKKSTTFEVIGHKRQCGGLMGNPVEIMQPTNSATHKQRRNTHLIAGTVAAAGLTAGAVTTWFSKPR